MAELTHLYFHSPCFDGISSAVLTWDYLVSRLRWNPPMFHAVNYQLRDSWLASPLERPSAVVDFLYHPQADFWADHHPTTFLDSAARAHYADRRGPLHVFDDRADSCAGLLWRHFAVALDYTNPSYVELVRWAEKIDAARYESPHEAIFAAAPALRISATLSLGGEDGYPERLIRVLRESTLEQVAELPEVRERFARIQELTQAGLDRLEKVVRLESDGIVVFDVDGTGVIINRYAPYYFFPTARYSAGVIRSDGRAAILTMRNPWRDFPSVFLGRICERLGGGGHQRVGAITLRGDRVPAAAGILERLVTEIRTEASVNRSAAS
jgi:hypothetical protein